MSYITTYSGEDFDPINPDAAKIKIIDIAHALSLICRANGHFKCFYSVAQHSINCAIEARARNYSKKVQIACLLHDASEAYIADITRPVKPHLTNYMEIENKLQSLIYTKFLTATLSSDEQIQVKQIDDEMLVCEFKILMEKPVFDIETKIEGILNFDTKDFNVVETQYINLFNCLINTNGKTIFSKNNFVSVGIDGCKGKWLAVALSNKGHEIQLFDKIDEVCECYKNADSILIDMPIGLAESKNDVRPDSYLRNRLKGKASSVFNTPCRQAVYEIEYTKASNINYEVVGNKLSRQSFAIASKIREIDSFLQMEPEWKNRLLESHPEYCFSILNNGIPVLEKKLTFEGANKRIQLLNKYYHYSYDIVSLFKNRYPAFSSKIDDLLDALVLALIGAIGLEAGFISLPECPMYDSQGIKMQIVGVNTTVKNT